MIDRSGVSHRQKWEAVELKKRVLNAWYWWFRKFRSSQQVKLHLWMILDVVTDLRGWLGNVLQNVRSAGGGFISHNFSPPVINRSPMKMRHLWRHRMFDIRTSETEWSSPVTHVHATKRLWVELLFSTLFSSFFNYCFLYSHMRRYERTWSRHLGIVPISPGRGRNKLLQPTFCIIYECKHLGCICGHVTRRWEVKDARCR